MIRTVAAIVSDFSPMSVCHVRVQGVPTIALEILLLHTESPTVTEWLWTYLLGFSD